MNNTEDKADAEDRVVVHAPGKLVKFVDENGIVVKEEYLNRRERRRRKIKPMKGYAR